jgi:uncharacterized protein (DUF2249 family)/quercetin dioxygenase-like cupin family protein
MTVDELDVRRVPKPQRHPLIFDRFSNLASGAAFVLVNNHDPKHLREEFERDQAGAFMWEYLEAGPREWRIRIGKISATGLPRVLCNLDTVQREEATQDAAGALWKLEMLERHLDANLVRLRADDRIAPHRGPDLDVLVVVVAGAGELITSAGTVALRCGDLAWLPRASERSLHAGPQGLSYLTVHPRRPALHIAVGAAGAF